MNALAVVTGASSGIGYELAKVLADNGFDLVVVAEDERIDEAAAQLKLRSGGVRVDPVRVDLSGYDGVEALVSHVRAMERPVDVLAWENFGQEWATDATRHLALEDVRVLTAAYGRLPDLGAVDWSDGSEVRARTLVSILP